LRAPGGADMWGRFVYREIVKNERLEWVNSFSDPEAAITRHPGHKGWPLEMLITVTFLDNESGTTLTLRSRAINANESERKTFLDGHDSMRGGFGGTFEQLEQYLAKQ
jgi:uncharacterized protein YndB with AHSA1/START domain